MNIIVQKFGGTSVSTEDRRKQVAIKVKEAIENGFTPIVVVSAMGRKGQPYATDTLLTLIDDKFKETNRNSKDLLMCCGEIIKVLSTQGVGTTYEVTMEFRIADINTNKDLWNRYNIPKHENEPDHVLVGKNFLIAEDNGINSDMLKELLKEEGAACDCAKNGMATVDLFRHSKKGQYDLIFMDVQMPDMDGYEATRAKRETADAIM